VTICLNMIVRDEAHVVRETLDSVSPHIDYWVVVDTGSTDSTIETIRAHMAVRGLQGEIHQRPWRDFGSNRTEALALCAGKADYTWVVDADDLIIGDLDLGNLRADSYLLRYGDDFRYWRKQIFRDGLRWRYVGAVHEHPICLDPATEERLQGSYYIESRRLGTRNNAADKYGRDCALLHETLERDPADPRSMFYLAQSYYDAGDYARALEWYVRRVEFGGWGEEVFFSLMRRGACLTLLGEPWERSLTAYLDAWNARPTRAEPLYEIARHYRLDDKFELGYLFAKRAAEIPYPERDSLFIAADVYGWRIADEQAICAYYTNRYEESFALCRSLLDGTLLPEAERPRVESNSDFCVPRIEEQRTRYPSEVIQVIGERAAGSAERADAEVTLTITACRRPVLFERTVNSFLQCCTDLDRISRWICVDTGSAAVDRARMRKLYPFFEFMYRDPDETGHADAMNLIADAVATPFWLHLEDDWDFFSIAPYVQLAIAILHDDPALAQVAFNRHYAETLEDRRVVGGEVRWTSKERQRYLVHQYVDQSTEEWQQHLKALSAGKKSAAYWPHFTLRPSIMRTEAIRSLGAFNSAPGHFELEFAQRYAAAGLKTAFLDEINCLHAGRLTTEGAGEGRLSAYELVGDGHHPAHPRAAIEHPVDHALNVTVINLDRRPDRLRSFRERLSAAAGRELTDACRRFAAIDGRTLTWTMEVERLFRGNDFGSRRAVIGCALSHLAVWLSLSERSDDAVGLVFEDDARPLERFGERLDGVLAELRDRHADFDLALLGYQPTDADGSILSRLSALPVAHWYHIYAAAEWHDPVAEHLAMLDEAGYAGPFHVGIVGAPNERAEALRELRRTRPPDSVTEADEGWEQVTLDALHEYAMENPGAVLYAHTKGAYKPTQVNIAWRQSMSWHVVRHWRDCAVAITRGFDAVGCHWLTPEEHGFAKPIFGGTFWMASTDYVRRLPRCARNSRHDAEEWIGLCSPRVLDLHPGRPQYPADPSAESARSGPLRPMRWQLYLGGLFGYVVSGRGARKLVDMAGRDGVQSGIDAFVMLRAAELKALECDPPLITAPIALTGNPVDSDIQYDLEPITDLLAPR
jgi:GR25 family glycosyltransferase involved in LPS biosynthesis/glycosyltransferase involved in cell wall biosynthesis